MSTQEVNDWFAKYDNPLKAEVQRVRELLMAIDERLEEGIKWQAPTFMYKGNMASFNPRSKKHVSLMFHTGAHIPGNFPHLEGEGDTARYMKFADMQEIEARADELAAIVKAWIEDKD
jgi:hypothetical protein